VDQLEVDDPERMAYISQTTLSVDETRAIINRLRRRFPAIVGPRTDDICYATTNRQAAVKQLAEQCDLVLVIGSRNSSNSNRLVEVAQRAGCEARLLDDESQLDPAWLKGVRTIGITAGASSPERIVQRVVGALEVLGPVTRSERSVAAETIRFALPPKVRPSAQGMV
jgi:4-hydroxy-3-methylbut-2-enyl diphosphate reductase